MRPIKFRAWVKATKTMIDLHKITPLALSKGVVGDGLYIPFMDEYELMQFTGRQDHFGKDIYEGDIIAPEVMGDANIDHYRMEEGKSVPLPLEIKWKHEGFNVPILVGAWKVIGNIYENPELLDSNQHGAATA